MIITILIISAIQLKLLNQDNIFVQATGAAAELTALFAFISLLTKKGLRWR